MTLFNFFEEPAVKLIHEKNNAEAKVGDLVTSFRGEPATILGMTEPRHPGSTGRVHVKFHGSQDRAEYYPKVFGLKWLSE